MISKADTTQSRLPAWPRLLGAELAAAYCGISKSTFVARVGFGQLPAPVRLGRRSLWDRQILDRFIDALVGANDDETDEWAGV